MIFTFFSLSSLGIAFYKWKLYIVPLVLLDLGVLSLLSPEFNIYKFSWWWLFELTVVGGCIQGSPSICMGKVFLVLIMMDEHCANLLPLALKPVLTCPIWRQFSKPITSMSPSPISKINISLWLELNLKSFCVYIFYTNRNLGVWRKSGWIITL